MLRVVMCAALLCGLVNVGLAEQASVNNDSATCTFQDGKQMNVLYTDEATGDQVLPEGKLWTPAKTPMLLFTQTVVSVGKSEIPIGAYSMYVIPQKDRWTLVLNKGVTAGSKYDEQQDLLRVPMQIGQVSDPDKQFRVLFGHLAPKQCNMRLYFGKTGTWVEFEEK